MRTCKICNELKPLTEFYQTVRNGTPYGYHGKCKKCYVKKQQENYDPLKQRDENLKQRYGKHFGLTQYDTLLENQGYKCAICGTTNPKGRKSGRGGSIDVFFVDHNHKTGEVRGLLCNVCNRTIGYVNEDVDLITNMLEYVKKHKSNVS